MRAFDNTIYGRGRWRINFYGDQVVAAFDIAALRARRPISRMLAVATAAGIQRELCAKGDCVCRGRWKRSMTTSVMDVA